MLRYSAAGKTLTTIMEITLYGRTAHTFRALIDSLYHGRLKGNKQKQSWVKAERVDSPTQHSSDVASRLHKGKDYDS